MSTSRLRFAPAPTGSLHIGSARTALFNWLYARHTGGELVLRIEDTNAELTRPELIDNIYRSLEWLQIDFDGEPVRQSERTDLYNDAVEQWLADGLAYIDDGAVRFRVPNQGTTSCWNDPVGKCHTCRSRTTNQQLASCVEVKLRRDLGKVVGGQQETD